MFGWEKERFGTFTRIRLINRETKEFVAFVPGFGGNVNELVLRKNGKTISVIDGFSSAEEMIQNKFMKSGRLIPFPNRILDGIYKFNGKKYQLPITEPARQNAIHGFFYNQPLEEKSIRSLSDRIVAELAFDYTGEYPGYPFRFSVGLTYTLTENHEFIIHSRVKNSGTQPLPFGDGWHPYFRLNRPPDELFLKLPASKKLRLTDRMVPNGETEIDNRFTQAARIGTSQLDTVFKLPETEGVAAADLIDPQENVTLRVWQETGPRKYNFMVVFIPPNRRSIAIEPMTCATNAFNNHDGLIVLEPGEVFEAEHGVKWVQ
ncbi:MAG: hypothetical protein GXO76_13325 [Calditrichaeota bacterium]|nr:hypothetical protein [Calditrichota bacterium]